MALFDDWKDATQRDTMARTISQGLTTMAKPLNQNFGTARQPDIPAEDAAAYSRQQAKPVATPGAPQAGTTPAAQNSVTTSQKEIGFGASSAAGGLTSNPFNVEKTSQPGISRVTGGGLSSPLYTNQSDASQAASGLGRQTISSGATTGHSGPAAGITASPFGATNTAGGAGISGGLPEGLARQARENAVRQSMIDSQRGGVHILGGGSGGMNADRQELLRKTMTAHAGAQNGQLTAAQLNAARGIMSDAQGESVKRTEINQRSAEAAQRGFIDLARQGIDMQRFGLDQQRFGMEQTEHAGRMEDAGFARLARQGLIDTANSTDQAAANKARMSAIAAGILKPDENSDWRLQVTPTTRAADGTTTAGSIYRYNQRTGDVQRVDDGGGQSDARAQALAAIKAGAPRDAVNQRLKAMGIDAV